MDGQPAKGLYISRLVDRQISEMLGMAKGIICDGVVNDAEVIALKQWMRDNPDVAFRYPGSYLAERIRRMYSDGVVEEAERAEMRDLLFDLAGEPDDLANNMTMPANFPLDNPPPAVVFEARTFTLTGIFASGSRPACQSKITQRGGRCSNTVGAGTDYLVIGLMASPAWVQSTHGRKIESAVRLKEQGHKVALISEPHWLSALG